MKLIKGQKYICYVKDYVFDIDEYIEKDVANHEKQFYPNICEYNNGQFTLHIMEATDLMNHIMLIQIIVDEAWAKYEEESR